MTARSLRTPVWILIGISRSEPAMLELVESRIALTTGNERVFDVPVTEISAVRFPWFYFGGGMLLSVGQDLYRISFVRPNDASDLPDRLDGRSGDGGAALLSAGRKVADIGEGRRAGKAWRAALEEVRARPKG